MEKYDLSYKKSYLVTDIFVFGLILIELLVLISFLLLNAEDPKNDSYTGRYALSIGFTIVGFIFGITGIKIIKVLKSSFPLFYFENRTKLILTTFYLTIPMFLRVVWDLFISLYPGALMLM